MPKDTIARLSLLVAVFATAWAATAAETDSNAKLELSTAPGKLAGTLESQTNYACPEGLTEDPDANRIKRVELPGYKGRLSFTQTTDGLVVKLPDKKVSDLTCALKTTASNLKPAVARP